MKSVEDLLSYISPSICLPGRQVFALSILRMRDLLLEDRSVDSIRIMKDVYGPVAEQTGKSRAAVSKAIDRAVEACWADGTNHKLGRVIGRMLPGKPFPKEFILYCAYYLAFGIPYHRGKSPVQSSESRT